MPTLFAACFDLDGTLVDTEPVHLRAEARCLDSLGIDPASRRHPRTFGMGIGPGMKVLAETYHLDARLVLDTYVPLWTCGLRRELRILPGATEVLAWLDIHQVPTAMVTSGDRAYVALVDSALSFVGQLKAVVTADCIARLKPDPEPYLRAAEALGVSPESCVGFEDSGAGVTALNAAGMLSVAVHADHASRPELQAARVKLDTLGEALAFLPRWFT